jgi:hypothetical protein
MTDQATAQPNIDLSIWDATEGLRLAIDKRFPGPSREKSLALTKLDECSLWLREASRNIR